MLRCAVLMLTLVVLSGSVVFASNVDQTLDRLLSEYENPAVETKDQVDQLKRMAEYPFDEVLVPKGSGRHADAREIVDWLYERGNAERVLKAAMIIVMAKRYAEFADKGKLVCFATAHDDAIQALRDDVGLPAPKGFAYIITGTPIPKEYRVGDTEEAKTRAVTIGYRYIMVESQVLIGDDGRAVDDKRKNVSHELTHAYVHVVGGEKWQDLPKWFDEGMAIHFSGSGPETLVSSTPIGNGGSIDRYQMLCDEYRRYYVMFEYLRHIKGKAKFNKFVREAINDHSTSNALVNLLGYEPSESDLYSRAKSWDQDVQLFRYGAFVWLVWAIWLMVKVNSMRYRHQNRGKLVPRYDDGVIDNSPPERIMPPKPEEIRWAIVSSTLLCITAYLLFWHWGVCITLL